GSGRVVAGSRKDLVRSGVSIAVRAGAPHPVIDSEQALRQTLLAAGSIGYSTGPSGSALIALLERWGVMAQLKDRLVLARPGHPVGKLLADGQVQIGFQQLSELMSLPGIDVIGPMPPGLEIITTFSAGLCAASTQVTQTASLIEYLASAQAAAIKQRNGMEPA
ncbi:MAG: substrate-binding domain-containing protein, partial [Quisquiliibacterium sp.]